MQITQYVVSLEIARKLKELGYPQKPSLFYWVLIDRNKNFWRPLPCALNALNDNYEIGDNIAAPISDEVLEKLQKEIEIDGKYYWLTIYYTAGVFFATYREAIMDESEGDYLGDQAFPTKMYEKFNPDIIASLWMKLKEGNYL